MDLGGGGREQEQRAKLGFARRERARTAGGGSRGMDKGTEQDGWVRGQWASSSRPRRFFF
jgi:hypothetical protein